jgi:hypothetical protein
MRAYLVTQKRLDKLLDAAPTAGNEKETENDILCKAQLQLRVSGPLNAVVERAKTAKAAWDALHREYVGSLQVRQPQLMTSLTELSQGSLTLVKYIDKVKQLRDDFEALSMEQSLPLLKQRFLIGLSDELRISCGPILHAFLLDESKTLDDLVEQVRSMSLLLPTSYASSNTTRSFPNTRHPDHPRRDALTCPYCHKPGHDEEHCFIKQRDLSQSRRPQRPANHRRNHGSGQKRSSLKTFSNATVMCVEAHTHASTISGVDKTALWYDTKLIATTIQH